ncbi:DUF6680 family protein [Inhella sp.]|uniref:DUF6680 family protein n=1 Tax=Inhella sp. TaxID=1921806 RepID=UPI0035B19693
MSSATFFVLDLKDWLVVIATLLSPVIAVQVSEFLGRRRQVRDEELRIFRTLMATRASTLDIAHVQALNTIDVVFSGKSAKQEAVRRQWKQYLDHLNDKNYPREHWETRRKELLVELLDTMGQHLGFNFDKTHLKNQSYYPQGYGDLEIEQAALRRATFEVVSGKRPLPMWVSNLPPQQGEPSLPPEPPSKDPE